MQIINIILVAGLFFAMLMGEVARVPITNGIAVSLLDIVTGTIFLTVIFKWVRNRSIPSNTLVIPLAVFLFVCIISLACNIFWLSPMEVFISFLYIVRFTFLASVYFFVLDLSKQLTKHIPFLIILVSGLLVLIGFAQYFYIDFTTLNYLDWDIHWYRLFSTFIDPNFIGIFLCLPLFLALHQLTKTKKITKMLWFYFISSLVLLIGILLTYSRTALVGLITGLIAYSLTTKKARKVLLGIGICLAIGIGIILANYQATEGTKLFRMSSSKARLTSITSAITVIRDHPILGVGFNAYRYAMHAYGYAISTNWQYSHSDAGTDNSFLFVLATTGIIGLASYVYMLYTIMYRILLTGAKTNVLRTVVFASFVAVILSSFFVNALFYPLILALLWILLGLTANERPL